MFSDQQQRTIEVRTDADARTSFVTGRKHAGQASAAAAWPLLRSATMLASGVALLGWLTA